MANFEPLIIYRMSSATANIIFISCSPDTLYYAWQVEVMLFNFKRHGIPMTNVHVLASVPYKGAPSKWFLALQKENPEVTFAFYEDTRQEKMLVEQNNKGEKVAMEYPLYIPSIVFHLLGKHYRKNQWLENKTIFHHDNDMIFRQLPNFDVLLNSGRCWGSDCNSYLGVDYVNSKGEFYITGMAKITGVSEQLILANRKNAAGAQYLIRDVDYLFWEKVERDSVAIYRFFNDAEKLILATDPKIHVLQKWTAGMWALLYNLYAQTDGIWTDDSLAFTFATGGKQEYMSRNILHNAGATSDRAHELFVKSKFMDVHPFNEDLSFVSPNFSSYYYAKEIADTANYLKETGKMAKYDV